MRLRPRPVLDPVRVLEQQPTPRRGPAPEPAAPIRRLAISPWDMAAAPAPAADAGMDVPYPSPGHIYSWASVFWVSTWQDAASNQVNLDKPVTFQTITTKGLMHACTGLFLCLPQWQLFSKSRACLLGNSRLVINFPSSTPARGYLE